MILKIKSFIYRFFNIFGLCVYIANKEEKEYLKSMDNYSEFDKSINLGLWQAKHGFTTIWTCRMPIHKAFIAKVKHAFDFRYLK